MLHRLRFVLLFLVLSDVLPLFAQEKGGETVGEQLKQNTTFGGYVIAKLGEIPKDGTQLELEAGGLHINVVEVKHHRIEVCKVKVLSRDTEVEEE